jgi:hypothetical protein
MTQIDISYQLHTNARIFAHADMCSGYIEIRKCITDLVTSKPSYVVWGYFTEFYYTWRLLTAFIIHLRTSLSRVAQIQSIPRHPISKSSSLILSTHPRFSLPSCLFPSTFPTNNLYALIFSSFVLHMQSNLISFYLFIVIILWEEYNLWCPSLCSFLYPPVTSFIFDLNIIFGTLVCFPSLMFDTKFHNCTEQTRNELGGP